MYELKLSTAITIQFFAFDSNGDGVTGKVDGDWTKRISKGGGAFAAMTVTITEMENGWYSLPIGTGHVDTLGILSVSLSATGVKRVNLQWRVETRIIDNLAFPNSPGNGMDIDGAGAMTVGAMAPNVITSTALATNAAEEIADTVWDELRSGHLVTGSFGQASQVIRDGTAQAGGVNSITLDAGASAVDDFYNNTVIYVVANTGVGQIRYISDYIGSTKQAVVAPNWVTTPDVTSVFVILPFQQWAEVTNSRISDSVWNDLIENRVVAGSVAQVLKPIRMGSAQAGAASTITLDAGASATDDYYNNTLIYVEAGVGSRQVRLIRDYVGSTKVATVTPNWVTNPDLNSQFVIYPDGLQNLAAWLSSVPNPLISGRPDVNVGALQADVITAASIANGAIDASTFAAGAIDAAAIAANAIGASELAQDAAREIADEVLDRDLAGGASGGSRGVRNALRALRNRRAIAAGTLTVYQENDTTAAWTAAVTTTAGNPVSEVDPA